MEEQPAPRPQLPEVGKVDRPRKSAEKKAGRRSLLLALAIACVVGYVLLVGTFLFIYFHRPALAPTPVPNNPRATEEYFDKINQHNMTKADVEHILGPGHKVSGAERFLLLHEPLPPDGVGSDTLTLKWQHQGDIILLEFQPPVVFGPPRKEKSPERDWIVLAGTFVREQGEGKKPKYKFLGMDKLQ